MLTSLEVGESALLVCGRRVSGGCTPLRGTIVNNVDTARSKQAFRSRVSTKDCEYSILSLLCWTTCSHQNINSWRPIAAINKLGIEGRVGKNPFLKKKPAQCFFVCFYVFFVFFLVFCFFWVFLGFFA
jgi:hypothetical protein